MPIDRLERRIAGLEVERLSIETDESKSARDRVLLLAQWTKEREVMETIARKDRLAYLEFEGEHSERATTNAPARSCTQAPRLPFDHRDGAGRAGRGQEGWRDAVRRSERGRHRDGHCLAGQESQQAQRERTTEAHEDGRPSTTASSDKMRPWSRSPTPFDAHAPAFKTPTARSDLSSSWDPQVERPS